MKFLYEYRTSDNAKHNGVIDAPDREAAYSRLKRQGIKPSRFAEAPGVFNKVFGKGKRWLLIALLAIISVVAILTARRTSREARDVSQVFDNMTRRQVIGDVAIIDKGIRDGWASVFNRDGERFLASFAIPGVAAGLRSTSKEEIEAALARQVPSTSQDGIEARQVKSIVEGMKAELRAFLADGGTIQQYGRRLVQRQEEEIAYYRRAKAEVDRLVATNRDKGDVAELVERYNAALRKIGVKLLVLPE